MSAAASRRIVITGASRGLGLEFTRRWLAAGHQVFALARQAEASHDLTALAEEHGERLWVRDCGVADDGSVAAAAVAIGNRWEAVDILLNNAGIYGPRGAGVEQLDLDDVRRVFEVNTLGPLRVTRALLPLIRKGISPRVVHMTSLMGSVTDNTSGGAYPYRLSKAALNMVCRNLAHELAADGIPSVVLHPGWVQTSMGGSGAPLSIEESVAAMIRTIESLTAEHGGGFFDRNGEKLPW